MTESFFNSLIDLWRTGAFALGMSKLKIGYS